MKLPRTFCILFSIMILCGLAATLAGCDKAPPPQVPKAEGSTSEYYYNGTIENCRLYRVNPDYGERFHLAICDHADAATSSRQTCGKNCTRHEDVQTVVRP